MRRQHPPAQGLRRIRNAFLAASALLSAALCLGAAAAWVASYRWSGGLAWTRASAVDRVEVSRGQLLLTRERFDPAEVYEFSCDYNPTQLGLKSSVQPAYSIDFEPPLRRRSPEQFWQGDSWRAGGDGYALGSATVFSQGRRQRQLLVPLWAFVLGFGILPAYAYFAFVRGWRERRRKAAGLCPACGYDLRHSKERCPECGRLVAPLRRPRPLAFWIAADLAFALPLAAVGLVRATDPAPPRPAGPSLRMAGGSHVYLPWTPAAGTGPDRMLYVDEWGHRVYRALWRRADQNLLVVVTVYWEFDGHLGMRPWAVNVFDRAGRRVAGGGLATRMDQQPYALLTMTQLNASVDDERPDWKGLGVGFVYAGKDSEFDPARPFVYIPIDTGTAYNRSALPANRVEVQRVQWETGGKYVEIVPDHCRIGPAEMVSGEVPPGPAEAHEASPPTATSRSTKAATNEP